MYVKYIILDIQKDGKTSNLGWGEYKMSNIATSSILVYMLFMIGGLLVK